MEENLKDLTTGSVSKKLVNFAAPIILASLLQAVYSVVDMMIVGHFVGATGMSAVSMGAQVTAVVLAVITGLTNGGTVLTAQLVGQRREKGVAAILGSLLTALTIAGIVITAAVMLLSSPLLRLFHTPEQALAQAVRYLGVCMIGTIFIYAYNAMASVLRGAGDSKRPMLIVLATVVANIVLDLLFVGVFHWDVVGAAAATVICQIMSAILAAVYIKRRTAYFDFKPVSFRIDRPSLAAIVKIGLPQAVQFLFASTSFLFLSGLVNRYGVYASAAAGAVAKIGSLALLPSQGMMAAMITLTAQNLAAGDTKRVLRGLRTSILCSVAIGVLICALCVLLPETVIRVFTSETEVIRVGVPYLRIQSVIFVLESAMFCMFGVITGSGYTPVTMCCGILSAFAVRYSAAFLFSQVFGFGFNGVAMGYPVGPLVSGSICLIFLLTGKWKKSRVRVRE